MKFYFKSQIMPDAMYLQQQSHSNSKFLRKMKIQEVNNFYPDQ